MIETIDLIRKLAKKHGVSQFDIKLQITPEGFFLIWNHVESEIDDDIWEVLDSHKIDDILKTHERLGVTPLLNTIDYGIRQMTDPKQADIIDKMLNKIIEGSDNNVGVMEVYRRLKYKLSVKKLDLMDRKNK